MSKTGASDFSCKKAFEISYALFRMAAVVKNRNFAGMLEAKAVALLDAAYESESGNLSAGRQDAEPVLDAIEYFVRFGTEAGLIHPRNSELLSKEIDILRMAIHRSFGAVEELPEADFAGLFSKPIPERSSIPAKRQSTAESQIAGNGTSIRQSAILERIRQSGNLSDGQPGCRMTDLQEAFPSISERTLRYDIEGLIAGGVVERIGSGRSTFYRAKTAQESVISLPASPQGQGAFEEAV